MSVNIVQAVKENLFLLGTKLRNYKEIRKGFNIQKCSMFIICRLPCRFGEITNEISALKTKNALNYKCVTLLLPLLDLNQ